MVAKSPIIKTGEFWQNNKKILPNLYDLMLMLLNIPPSSAHIERYFSICGVICDQRSTNIKDELIIARSLLKVNIEIIDKF